MKKLRLTAERQYQHETPRVVGLILLMSAPVAGLWIGFDRNQDESVRRTGGNKTARGDVAASGIVSGGRRRGQAKAVWTARKSATGKRIFSR